MFHEHKFGFRLWRERLFHKGDFKYLILDLIKDKPRYGYEIIRALEERFHGFYVPSPGVVYPTLQMLEEMGYVTATERDGKKTYTMTESGLQFLAEREQVAEDAKSQMEKWWNPQIHRSLHQTKRELWGIAMLIFSRARELDSAKLERIQETLARAQKDIEAILAGKA